MYPTSLCKVNIILQYFGILYYIITQPISWNMPKNSDHIWVTYQICIIYPKNYLTPLTIQIKNQANNIQNIIYCRCLCSSHQGRYYDCWWSVSFLLCYCWSWWSPNYDATNKVVSSGNGVDLWQGKWIHSFCSSVWEVCQMDASRHAIFKYINVFEIIEKHEECLIKII